MPGPDSAVPTGEPNRRFIVFTCRDVKTDFRWPLAEALRARHETWYIWLRRRPRLLRPGAGAVMEDISLAALLALLMRLTRGRAINTYLNTTNTSFPFIIPLLRLLCGPGIWIMDMHDDLLYDLTGWRRAQAALAVKIQVWAANITIRSAESLVELFPASLPFGNASQIRPIARGIPDYCSVLVLASLDSRFDFAFMSAVAATSPGRVFEIHGQVARGDARIAASVAALCDGHSNIVYHGAYGLADLESILGRYAVTLAPYCTHTRLTRYLDPLRYYHCLNSGMELISTIIPQTERLQRGLHAVTSPEQVEPILQLLETSANARRNTVENYHPQNWEQRANELIRIAAGRPMSAQPLADSSESHANTGPVNLA